MSGFEPETSSLPRKCSTPELHRPLSQVSKMQLTWILEVGDKFTTFGQSKIDQH